MNNSNQEILVTGATGNQGGSVARHLLQRKNFAVHAFVRDKNKEAALALQQAGAKLIQGDFDDPNSLDRAMQGVTGVFSVQDFNNGSEVEVKHGKAIVDAAKAAGIKHLVYSSVGSAERNTGIPHFDSKFEIEEYIRASGVPYTILRPVFFFFNYNYMRPMIESGTIYMPLSPDRKLQQLSEDDYGNMVAEVFDRRTYFLNREIEVASVEMSMTEIAKEFSGALGTNVNYQQIPFETFEQQMGKEMSVMFNWFEQTGYRARMEEIAKDFFIPTTFENYLQEHGWAK